ncbi:MAG: putative rhs-related transrane protein, partial [Segetibacter sp.]|nr:putative rhs-related transrane protein [Segetibacter sp.]
MFFLRNKALASFIAGSSFVHSESCNDKAKFAQLPNIFNKQINKQTHTFKLFLIPLGIISGLSAVAQTNQDNLIRTPQNVTVQRSLPPNILSYGEAMPANFSKIPTDEEIYRVHFFEEPLVPSNLVATSGENEALVYALAGFSQRNSPDSFSLLLKFLKDYPKSRWRGALLADLGIVYRRTGYYNQAMASFQEAWDILKGQKEAKVKVLADRLVSELLLMHAWTGNQEKIDSLLKEIDHRVIEGPAEERIVSVREGLWLMKNNPGISFMCGPYALNKLFTIQDSTKAFSEKLMDVQSPPQGFSLAQLMQMAQEVGLKYQMAFREPGAAVIENSVVHWKLNHYSALLKIESAEIKCEDATVGSIYGQQFWLTGAALDSSASGYFLVPDGLLPKGWRRVSGSEGSTIFGKGQVPSDNKGKNTACGDPTTEVQSSDPQSGCTSCNGGKSNPPMAQSNVHTVAISLHIFDQPIYYTPPNGPAVIWNIDYHQRDSYQPANFSYSNMGPKWTFKWLSYVQDNPNNPFANADVYLMGGGVKTFTGYDVKTQSYAPQLQFKDVLVRVCATCYELRHPDGSKEVYGRPDGNTSNGRKIFLTQRVDVSGNTLTLSYDANLRIAALIDAIGQVTIISYENGSDIYKITKVTDPFGRSARFEYDSKGRLVKITDMIGIISTFHYSGSDFIEQMTTPYGTTSFIKEEGPGNYRSLETHFPMGEKERVEFAENAKGTSFRESVLPQGVSFYNQYINYRATYFWDKKAMQDAPGDYTKAKVYHWLHGSPQTGENGFTAPILESMKEPLENRVWYNYQGERAAG